MDKLIKELFGLFDQAEEPHYKGYGIYSKVSNRVSNLNNFRQVWLGYRTPKGTPRSVQDTPENRKKAMAAIRQYKKELAAANKEIKKALES